MSKVRKNTQRFFKRLTSSISSLFKGKQKTYSSVMEMLDNRFKYRTQQDVKKWRQAQRAAEDPYYPSRYHLTMLYEDVLLDADLSGAISNRKNAVMRTDFVIRDKEGSPNKDLKNLFQKEWFIGIDIGDGFTGGFMSLALDTIYWGHTLIEFQKDAASTPNPFEFSDVEVVPREHIVPNTGKFHPNPMDVTNGISYRQPPFTDWMIELGHPKSLGMLFKASLPSLSNKNINIFWEEHAELFGMPIRIGKTSSTNPDDLKNMDDMLKNMGSAAWGRFSDHTSIEIKESNKSDAYKIYKEKLIANNEAISKLILGATMLMMDGSSHSQSKVHLAIHEKLLDNDRLYLQMIINTKLIPLMVKHGYPTELANHEFQWVKPSKITKDERENDQFILDNFELDENGIEFYKQKYRVPIIGLKLPQEPQKKKALPTLTNHLHKRVMNMYKHSGCQNHTHSPIHNYSIHNEKLWDLIRELTKKLHNGTAADVPAELTLQIGNELFEGIQKNWNADTIDYTTLDNAKLNYIRSNTFKFSGAKTASQIKEMRELLIDSDGKVKPFSSYLKDVQKVHEQYNKVYLKAEYNLAVASGQSASQWLRIQETAEDIPNIEYQTVGDERVRKTHEALDGIILPIDHSFWEDYYPPNGWQCRCDAVPTDSDVTEPPELLEDVPEMFKNNVGITGKVYPKDHPYFEALGNPSAADYGLRSIEQIKENQDILPKAPEQWDTNKIQKWWENNDSIKDSRGVYIKPLKDNNDLATMIDILINPDEAYSDGEGNIIYIKYYKGQELSIRTNGTDVISIDIVSEDLRQGTLEYKS